jgi:hypothetical protein
MVVLVIVGVWLEQFYVCCHRNTEPAPVAIPTSDPTSSHHSAIQPQPATWSQPSAPVLISSDITIRSTSTHTASECTQPLSSSVSTTAVAPLASYTVTTTSDVSNIINTVSTSASGSKDQPCGQQHPSFIYQYSAPNQPQSVHEIPSQHLPNRVLAFQHSWFSAFPWLHYSPELQSVLCYHCAKADSLGLLKLASKSDSTFISSGFKNWKKGKEKCSSHEASHTHSYAVNQLQQSKAGCVVAQISRQKQQQQREARTAVMTLLSSMRYLARQGLAIRGHETDTGNYYQLVKLRRDDVSELHTWLQRTTNFMSSDVQNEMLTLLGNTVVRKLIETIRKESQQFGVIVDGTQDCTGTEQESLCLRYIDRNLEPREVFVGLFEPVNTCGDTIANMIEDCLVRLGLSLDALRAQTYDGASNMSGEYKGCQARISSRQPLALWFHCGAHCANLVAQSAASSVPQVRDAIAIVHELGVLYSRSSKYRAVFRKVATSSEGSLTTLKPLCPTRWLCRTPALQAVINQYTVVLESLADLSQSTNGDVATKANGLLDKFQQGHTLLLLNMALAVFSLLEQLNRGLQAKCGTISGMIDAVTVVKGQLESMRTATDDKFGDLFSSSSTTATLLQLGDIEMPRGRRPPRKYTGTADAYNSTTAEDHYRIVFYQLVDVTVNQLADRFDTTASGISTYLKLESVLLKGKQEPHHELLCGYPELDTNSLSTQLALFRSQMQYSDLMGAVDVMKEMSSDVRKLFPQVDRLLRLLLICPASSCEAERSFSGLRRLKTWLRNSMTQSRLNAVAICHVHQSVLDEIDLKQLAAEFVSRSQIRKAVFGQGPF